MQHNVAASTFARVEALSALPETVITEIARAAITQRYARGDAVVEHGDHSRDLYIILSGAVRVSLVATTGRELTYQLLPAGEMFGEIAAVDGLPRTAGVLAEEDTVLARIGPSVFDNLTREHHEFVLVIMQRLTRLNRRLSERLFEYHAYDVRGRVYAELLRLTEREPAAHVSITDRDMASRVGTTRENVSRIHADLRRRGLIERHHSALSVMDRSSLEEMLESSAFG